MPLKKTIFAVLGFVLVLLIAMVALLLLSPEQEQVPVVTDPPAVQVLFDQNHVEHVEKMSFVYKDREEISVNCADGGWQVLGRPGLPADPDKMTALLEHYEQILALRTVTENCPDPAEYGLDAPCLTVTLSVHGTEKTYLFGSENTYYEGYYCMLKGSSAVYLLDYAYVTAFDLTAEDLLAVEKLPALSAISSLEWTCANGATADDLSALQSALATLEIDRMVDFGSEQYPIYGLDAPAVAALTLTDGQTLTLHLSEGETEELIYLTVDDREIIYLITCDDMQTLLEYIRNE